MGQAELIVGPEWQRIFRHPLILDKKKMISKKLATDKPLDGQSVSQIENTRGRFQGQLEAFRWLQESFPKQFRALTSNSGDDSA